MTNAGRQRGPVDTPTRHARFTIPGGTLRPKAQAIRSLRTGRPITRRFSAVCAAASPARAHTYA